MASAFWVSASTVAMSVFLPKSFCKVLARLGGLEVGHGARLDPLQFLLDLPDPPAAERQDPREEEGQGDQDRQHDHDAHHELSHRKTSIFSRRPRGTLRVRVRIMMSTPGSFSSTSLQRSATRKCRSSISSASFSASARRSWKFTQSVRSFRKYHQHSIRIFSPSLG